LFLPDFFLAAIVQASKDVMRSVRQLPDVFSVIVPTLLVSSLENEPVEHDLHVVIFPSSGSYHPDGHAAQAVWLDPTCTYSPAPHVGRTTPGHEVAPFSSAVWQASP